MFNIMGQAESYKNIPNWIPLQLDSFEKFQKRLLALSCLSASARPPRSNNSAPTGRIFIIQYFVFEYFLKSYLSLINILQELRVLYMKTYAQLR
jgi:hypothetical protein